MSRPVRPVQIPRRLFRQMIRELRRRGGGRRESGAFLLGSEAQRRVTAIAYYDDLDPMSLNGAILMQPAGFSALNHLCAEHGLQVLADIHTHPSTWVDQSGTDASNPMSSFRGHVALIAPNYAQGRVRPRSLGAHLYLGGGQWEHFAASHVDEVFKTARPWRPIAQYFDGARTMRKASR